MICVDDAQLDCSRRFSDGTFAFKLPVQSCCWQVEAQRTVHIRWNYESEDEMLALFYAVNHLREHGAREIELILPYIPNARMDRVVKNSDVFTLKYFAKFLNSLDFSRVFVLDPHSYVSAALIDRVSVGNPSLLIRSAIEDIGADDLIIYFPDEGAVKRYSSLVDRPFIYGEKKRDWSTGTITGLHVVANDVPEIKGHPILMVDDICSHGGTFYHSATALKALGAGKIYVYCSHCENSILEGKLVNSGIIEHFFTTDSIFTRGKERPDLFTVTQWR